MATFPQLPREVVVFDTEFTAWEGSMRARWNGPGRFREIVQIGAVKLSVAGWTELGSFERIVRPRVNSRLSRYFV